MLQHVQTQDLQGKSAMALAVRSSGWYPVSKKVVSHLSGRNSRDHPAASNRRKDKKLARHRLGKPKSSMDDDDASLGRRGWGGGGRSPGGVAGLQQLWVTIVEFLFLFFLPRKPRGGKNDLGKKNSECHLCVLKMVPDTSRVPSVCS